MFTGSLQNESKNRQHTSEKECSISLVIKEIQIKRRCCFSFIRLVEMEKNGGSLGCCGCWELPLLQVTGGSENLTSSV